MTKESNDQEKTTRTPYLTLTEVADKLGMSRMTVYRYVIAKQLPAYQFGKHFRVRSEDLDSFIASRKV